MTVQKHENDAHELPAPDSISWHYVQESTHKKVLNILGNKTKTKTKKI